MLHVLTSTDEIAQSLYQEVPGRQRWESSVSLVMSYKDIHLQSLLRDAELPSRPTQSN